MAEHFSVSTIYTGTVDHVVKTYGFIRLDNGKPVNRAFFDRNSVRQRLDDLSETFSTGCKVRANIKLTDGEHKIKYKAINMCYNDKDDQKEQGGDSYLKKYLIDYGAIQLEQLVEYLKIQTRNCPRFLRTGDVKDVEKVVNKHQDIFQIKLGFLCLREVEQEVLNEILSNMEVYGNKIPIEAMNSIINPDHQYRKYLRTTDQWNVGIKNFVARNAGTLIFWDNTIWDKKYIFLSNYIHGFNDLFQKELAAVKYYSEFVTQKGPISISSLCGHYNQASDEIKNVATPRGDDFQNFLEKNSFFFVTRGGIVMECPDYRLAAINASWIKKEMRLVKVRTRRESSKPIPSTSEENLGSFAFSRQLHPAIRAYTYEDTRGKGGEQYMKKYLAEHGPGKPYNILCKLSQENDAACPPFLKWNHFQIFYCLATQHPTLFSINNGVLCHSELENKLLATCSTFERIELKDFRHIFPMSEQPGKYLFASGSKVRWIDCVKDFVARHPDKFMFWRNMFWRRDTLYSSSLELLVFERDMRAVKYYSKFIQPHEEGIEIVSVSGHFGQADNIVKLATSQNEEDFTEFIKRNYFFFDIIDKDEVKISKEDRLDIIDKFWLNKSLKSPVPVILPQPAPRRKASSKKKTTPSVPNSPVKPMKAFSESSSEVSCKPVPCSNEADEYQADRFNFQTSFCSQPLLNQSQEVSLNNVSTASYVKGASCGTQIYGTQEAAIFQQIVGDDISRAIEKEIHSLGGQTLNCLLLLRLNVGKQPLSKFRIPGSGESSNCTLKTGAVKTEDMQRILRQNVVVKSETPLHHGVKNTLHSIRTLEQGGKVAGLTVFCQLHEKSDGLLLDIWNGKKLTAVFTGNYPYKSIYDYLRCRCEQLAQNEDVLVMDVDGQLSGCDDQPHYSLGGVARILCSSSAELSDRINDAIQHMHEYVVVIGIDSNDQLKSLQKMCSKDTRVIAEISSELKSVVENMF